MIFDGNRESGGEETLNCMIWGSLYHKTGEAFLKVEVRTDGFEKTSNTEEF